MAENSTDIADCQLTALLRHGVVVLDAELDGKSPHVTVSAPSRIDAAALVRDEFGKRVEVDVAGSLPREHRPLQCVGQMEREPGRLQLRFVLQGDDHVDDIVVAEDDGSVVVLATVCSSVGESCGDPCGVPCHVYLDRPLGDRVVFDGHRGEPVPYFNVYEHLRQEDAAHGRVSAHRD